MRRAELIAPDMITRQHLAEILGPSLAASAAPALSLAPSHASAASLPHKVPNHVGALDQARGAKTEAAGLPSVDDKTYRTKSKMLADVIRAQADERGQTASANAAAFFVCRDGRHSEFRGRNMLSTARWR
jgi:hypothetical protein